MTMAEVARRTGVSVQTVSAVVNGKPGISEPTRVRIRQVIEELDYQPNHAARLLRNRQSVTIGVIISSITNPFFPGIVQGIETVAREHGYIVILCNDDADPSKRLAYLEALRQQQVAGIIAAYGTPAPETDASLRNCLARGIPVVLVSGHRLDDRAVTIHVDNRQGMASAVAHLIALGHRRIAMISPPDRTAPQRDRLAGFIDAHTNAGLAHDPALVLPGGFGVEDGERAAERLVHGSADATAIVAANDLVAIGAIAALKRLGRRVPHDIAVVGYDDIPMSSLYDPPLTTVAQPLAQLGAAAMRAILERAADRTLPGGMMHFGTRLVVRGSTAPPATRTDRPRSWTGRGAAP